ncbi:MAG TPA: hypothetical protein VGM30_24845 [Puia sp.]
MAIYKTEEGVIVTVDPLAFNKRKIVACEGLATEELQVLKNELGFFIGTLYKSPIKRSSEWLYSRRYSDCFWQTRTEAEAMLIAGNYPIYIPALPAIPSLDNISANYRWAFSISIIDGKGRKFKNHCTSSIAETYDNAKDLMYYEILGKKGTLLKINSVTITRAFALYKVEGWPPVPDEIFKKLPLPKIPDVLWP